MSVLVIPQKRYGTLANAYEDKGIGRRLALERKLYRYELKQFVSIEEYINAVTGTVQDLADIGRKIDDLSIGAILLGGLPEEYDPLVMALENSCVDITSQLVKQKLLNESAKRESRELVFASKLSRAKKIVCYRCKEPGHKSPNCPQKKKGQKSKQGYVKESTLMSFGAGGSISSSDWYVDSGASTHMSCKKEWLSNFNSNVESKVITLANNKNVSSTGIGDVQLLKKNNLELSSIKNVLFVPELSTNLISVSKAVDKDITVVFDKRGCNMYNNNNVKVVGKPVGHATRNVGGLYRLDHIPICPVSAMVGDVHTSSSLWHRRLGHLCRAALEHLRHGQAKGIEYSSLDKNPCVACIEGKQCRKPFKTIEYKKGTRMLELIHSDVCGPFDVFSLENRTPYELWYNRKPDLAHLRVFGCRAYVNVPACDRHKLDPKAKQYIFVGYCDDNKSYRFRDPINVRKSIKGRDVVFLENCFSDTVPKKNESPGRDIILSSDTNILQVQGSSAIESALNDDSVASTSSAPAVPTPPALPISPLPETSIVPAEEEVVPVETGMRYNLRDRKPVNYRCTVCCSTMLSGELTDEPYSYSDALSRPDKAKWIAAMEDEYNSLMTNGTWTLIENKGQKVIPCKWVFKLKRDSEGNICRYKARLVAKGFHQSYGIDYEETFSPVVRYSSLRVLIALAVEQNLKMHHLDIDTAFLYGKLEENVFMVQPEGFIVEGEETKVCHLNKSLYGLKQAARAWNKRLDKVLLDLGYNRLQSEPCIYLKRGPENISILAVYVDDLIFIYDNEIELSYLKNGLTKYFGVKDLGELSYCLGLHIARENGTNDVKVDQKRYILETLSRFNMSECKTVTTPMDVSIDLRSQTESAGNVPYQNLIGCLMFLAINTRPDILFAVSFLSQFNQNPMQAHWTAAKRVLQYLKGTLDYGLTFKRTGEPLCGFVDADWANGSDRRSYTGYVFKLANAPVSWECKKQPTVALSSTEAEYMALTSAAKEAVFLQRLIGEITGESYVVTLCNDNQSAQKLAQNPVHHNRTKHIDVRYHFIRELVENNKIKLSYLPTDRMLADILTKGLSRCKHQRCVSDIGLMIS